MNVLVIGGGAREMCIAEMLAKDSDVYAFMPRLNPGIKKIAKSYAVGNIEDGKEILDFVNSTKHVISFAVIGQEQPLAAGVVDFLEKKGIPCVGPDKELAQLESSKSFTRELLFKYNIDASPKHRIFSNSKGLREYVEKAGPIVVKPDGLTGGKGVKVWGEHLSSIEDVLSYCEEILSGHGKVVIEEKLEGEEFSLQSLTDGEWFLHLPPVQDHKRAFDDDRGPNTGGMGSYSDADFSLPFLENDDVEEAKKITEEVASAIKSETGKAYKGVMYGGFIKTKNGVKLIEYNARLGDPEAMNVLPLIRSSFTDICRGIVEGDLERVEVEIENKATVVKYIVPAGYPDAPTSGKVEIGNISDAKVYFAAVDEKEDGIYTTTSRAVAILGMGENIAQAEKRAEHAAAKVTGRVFHRKDIGTKKLLDKRVNNMERING